MPKRTHPRSVLTCDRARTDMLDFSTRDLGTCEFTGEQQCRQGRTPGWFGA